MENQAQDQPVLNHIQHPVAEEHRLHSHGPLDDPDRERLTKIQVGLDRCWGLLRQRRALRDAGGNPGNASIRMAEVVEKYEH